MPFAVAKGVALLVLFGGVSPAAGTFQLLRSGNCRTPIRTKAECESAAAALGLADTTAEVDTELLSGYYYDASELPPYCYYAQIFFRSYSYSDSRRHLYFNFGSNAGSCSEEDQCICQPTWPPPPPPQPSPPPQPRPPPSFITATVHGSISATVQLCPKPSGQSDRRDANSDCQELGNGGDWRISFDSEGWSTCDSGYAMAGLNRERCNQIYCLEGATYRRPASHTVPRSPLCPMRTDY